jgi:hypothetical protein
MNELNEETQEVLRVLRNAIIRGGNLNGNFIEFQQAINRIKQMRIRYDEVVFDGFTILTYAMNPQIVNSYIIDVLVREFPLLINKAGKHGTPLYLALNLSFSRRQPDNIKSLFRGFAQFLHDNGAKLNQDEIIEINRNMLLHRTGRANIARILLENGADPTIRNNLGQNPLDIAKTIEPKNIEEAEMIHNLINVLEDYMYRRTGKSGKKLAFGKKRTPSVLKSKKLCSRKVLVKNKKE